MKYKQWRQYNKAVKTIEKLQKRFDGLYDPLTSRGSSDDRTTRLRGRGASRTWGEHLELYKSNGFIQNIIDVPANDAIREWITIETNLDEQYNISRMIQTRMDELKVREKMRDLVRYARMYEKGSWLYYGIIAEAPQDYKLLKEPLPLNTLKYIDFINVIDNPDRVSILEINQSEPLKKDYREYNFLISGTETHKSRFSWLVNNFIPEDKRGMSQIDIVFDSISAQDSALWSTSTMVQDMATKIFKSDLIANLEPTKKAELLSKLKHIMTTLSSIVLTSDEDFQKLTYNVTGIREIFEFIFDNLAGVSNIPKNILLGKAHGVVTAGEYDTLNYYAQVSNYQENYLRPIIDKIIKLILHEQCGEIYRTVDNINEIDWKYEFNSLWTLDPISQADVDLKKSQRDEIDFNIGKANSEELRNLDERYSELEDFETEATREINKIIEEEEK